MVQMTYLGAQETILENTEMGYTLKSQDKLWMVFWFDTWSEDSLKYNRVFPVSEEMGSYEMWEDELCWTTRTEAETYAETLRIEFATKVTSPDSLLTEPPEVYVINWGDDSRYESYCLGTRPNMGLKYKGSAAAVDAMQKMRLAWRNQNMSGAE